MCFGERLLGAVGLEMAFSMVRDGKRYGFAMAFPMVIPWEHDHAPWLSGALLLDCGCLLDKRDSSNRAGAGRTVYV